VTLAELLRREPSALVGEASSRAEGPTLGLLVKLLDAGQRLPVHCHPSRQRAREMLGSPFGKTEAWLILGTDETAQPRLWGGLREEVPREQFRSWIEDEDGEALLDALVEYAAQPGDVFFVPGGTPHAIGAGVFLLELQEPTDYSVVAETRGFPIDHLDASLALGWERAINFFDLRPQKDLRQAPTKQSSGVSRLFDSRADAYFRALRMRVDGEARLPFQPAYAVGVVLGGVGVLSGATKELSLQRGFTFVLPAAAVPGARISGTGLDLVWCLGPDPAAVT
jgi:mannose-6-phosphate isomerase